MNDDCNAQPVESSPLQVEDNSLTQHEVEKAGNLKNDQSHARVKCTRWEKHKSNDFLPLKEETNNNYINPGQLLHGMQCARCERTLVKSSKAEHYNKVFDTIFNSRKPVMCCEELLTE